MSQEILPDGEKPALPTREEAIQKYKVMLAECIAKGDPLVPLWKNFFITSKTFTIATVRRWVYEGRFPWIKIGRRRYTSNKVLAQWILDSQQNPELFCLNYTKTPSKMSWQWKKLYQRARERTNERRKAAGLPPLPDWTWDEKNPKAKVVEEQIISQPSVKPEIIIEDLLKQEASDEDLYRDPG